MDSNKKTYKCSEVKRSCHYCSILSGNEPVCNYCLMESHSRGCDPEQCDKYVPRARVRKGGRVKKNITKTV